MNKLIASVATVTLCLASSMAIAEEHHAENKTFTVSDIKPGFHLLQGKGGNILLSEGTEGLLIVDSDYSEMTPALEKTLARYDGGLKYVLNTHWHGDHTQGNQTLGHKADIIAHDNVYTRLNSRQEVKLFNMVSEPYDAHALPNITFDHSLTLHFNNETIKALHLPNGHTDGDSIIFFENANIVHMGDHYFNGMFPFVDVDSQGSVRGIANNIAGMLDKIDDKTVVVPGHGAISNKKELVSYKDMLLGTANEVEAMMKDSMSLQAIQDKGLSKQWDAWGHGFIKEKVWISIVHSSLTQDASQHAAHGTHNH